MIPVSETLAGTCNDSNRTFTFSKTYVPNNMQVFIDDTPRFCKGADYVELTDTSIYFNTPPSPGEVVRANYFHPDQFDGFTPVSQSPIRAELMARFPQIVKLAANILDGILENDPDSTITKYDVLDLFIADSMIEHSVATWGTRYNKAVIYFACYLITEAQSEAVNSGVVVSVKSGSAENGSLTEYMRPALANFGAFSVTKYGRMWEALRAEKVRGSFNRGLI